MARIDIPFIVKQQHITQPTRETLVSGGQNYFYATFEICDKWSDVYNLKAVFVRENISKLIDLEITETGYECQIPWEVMADKGSFQVGIFGGDRLLTDYAYVIVKQGCVVDGEAPLPPTPDWFVKTDEELKNIKKDLENIEVVTDDVLDIKSDNPISNKAVTTAVNKMTDDINTISEQNEVIRSDVEGLQTRINEEAHFRGYLSTNAKIQSLEATPNDFAYSAESGTKWIYAEEWSDSGIPVPDQLTPASDVTPLMNGEASTGSEEAYARGDHRHPTDTSRVSVAEFNSKIGDIETALDGIIAIQNSLLGGDSV